MPRGAKKLLKLLQSLFATIKNAPDAAFLAVPNVQRAIGGLRHPVGPGVRVGRIHQRRLAREAAREYLERPRWLPIRERLEGDIVAILRHRCPIPGTVKSDERAALILFGELLAGIEHNIHRRPMGGEGGGGRRKRATAVRGLAVS